MGGERTPTDEMIGIGVLTLRRLLRDGYLVRDSHLPQMQMFVREIWVAMEKEAGR
jgi:hypothetical protein